MRPVNITRCPSRPYRFEPPFSGDGYALLLYVAASDVTPEEQIKISEAIIASGCRYAVCYGHRCSSWDDSIDLAAIEAGKEDKEFVMTTWHEKDSPEDVVYYFWWNTMFDDFVAERMGVFVLGSHARIETELESEITKMNEPQRANQTPQTTRPFGPRV